MLLAAGALSPRGARGSGMPFFAPDGAGALPDGQKAGAGAVHPPSARKDNTGTCTRRCGTRTAAAPLLGTHVAAQASIACMLCPLRAAGGTWSKGTARHSTVQCSSSQHSSASTSLHLHATVSGASEPQVQGTTAAPSGSDPLPSNGFEAAVLEAPPAAAAAAVRPLKGEAAVAAVEALAPAKLEALLAASAGWSVAKVKAELAADPSLSYVPAVGRLAYSCGFGAHTHGANAGGSALDGGAGPAVAAAPGAGAGGVSALAALPADAPLADADKLHRWVAGGGGVGGAGGGEQGTVKQVCMHPSKPCMSLVGRSTGRASTPAGHNARPRRTHA